MRRSRLLFSALAALLCCFLASCSMSLTGRDVLTPPRALGAQSALQELIGDHADGDYSLVYPSAGDYQNAVIPRDIDGDGEEESLALYRRRNDVTHILIIRRSGDSYAVAGEAAVAGVLIEHIDFADLDGDGREEVIVVYPDKATGLLSLTVVRADDSSQADMPACCNHCLTGDFDGDGRRDIMLLSLSSSIGSAAAKLLKYSDGTLSVTASCEMDSQLTAYDAVISGGVSEGITGVFVDGSGSSGELTTQVLYYDPSTRSLLNPLFLYAGYDSTRRADRVFSADVDGDGLVELPICSPFDYGLKEAAETVCRRVTWNSYSASDMVLGSKRTDVLCEALGFRFSIGEGRVGSVSARYADADTVCLYAWEFRSGEMRCTDLLLTLRRVPKDAFDPAAQAMLAESDDAVYTYAIAPVSGSLGFTEAEVRAGFTVIGSAAAGESAARE